MAALLLLDLSNLALGQLCSTVNPKRQTRVELVDWVCGRECGIGVGRHIIAAEDVMGATPTHMNGGIDE
jgi:hypothetical protein